MTVIEQIATYLEDELLLGTIGTDIFLGRLPENPESPVECIAVLDTGGVTPDIDIPTKSPTFQILIRASNYDDGKEQLDIIRTGLHASYGQLVANETYFLAIHALSEGGHIGQDEAGRDLFSINFLCKTR